MARDVRARQTPTVQRVQPGLGQDRPTAHSDKNQGKGDDGTTPRRPGADRLLEIQPQRLARHLPDGGAIEGGRKYGRPFFLVG